MRHSVVRFGRSLQGGGKGTDVRAAGFIERQLVQVELGALDPSDLRDLYAGALADFWDTAVFEATVALEDAEVAAMTADDEELEP
jgi:hypothetical protein